MARGATPEASAAVMAEALLDLAAAIDAGACQPSVLARIAEPYSVRTQMGRLFAAHAALAQRRMSANRA